MPYLILIVIVVLNTKVLLRLFHELQKSGGTGLAAIAAAGGLGSSLLLQA